MLPAPAINYPGFYGQFSPPPYGGPEAVMYFTVTFATTAGATAFILPASSSITGFGWFVNTAFSGGTTTLSVGHTGSATYYLSAASVVGTPGPTYSTAWAINTWFTRLASPETITVTVGTSNTAGTGVLSVRYALVES